MGTQIGNSPPPSVRAQLLREAEHITSSDRNTSYGEPETNFGRIAALWNVYIQQRRAGPSAPLQPYEVALLMVLMKVARLMNDGQNYDGWLDIAGYAATGWDALKAEWDPTDWSRGL